MQEDKNTHSTEDGPEGHKPLNVVGQVSAVGVPVRVLASLQDKLLSLEIMMFITHPAEESKRRRVSVPVHTCALMTNNTIGEGCPSCPTSGYKQNTRMFWTRTVLVLYLYTATHTHAPLSTRMERMLSKPHCWMLQHSEVNSWHLPWKCSCSNTVTCRTMRHKD